VLETERLRLRAYRVEDFPIIAAMWSDPIVNRYTTVQPLPPEETWAKTLRNAGLWSLLGFGYWALEEKATGGFVGELGFADFKRDIQPSLEGIPEMGWVLMSRVHGKGYATEAARCALQWATEHCGAKRAVCIIHDGNAPSVRVAEKCGFREYQHTRYKDHDVTIYSRKL